MVDILLIQPPVRDYFLTVKRTIPYGLACIAASLETQGFSVRVFDAMATVRKRTIDPPPEMGYLDTYYGRPDRSPIALFHQFRHFGYSYEHMGNIAKKSGAFLVGISSLFTAYCGEAVHAAETVKKALPGCRVVVGGHHPTSLPEAAMESPAVDFAIRGEGESSMPLLAGALKSNTPLESVPGIVFRKPGGGLHVSPPAIVEEPDRLFPPALDHVNHDFYKRGKFGSTVVVASRGCPMSCTYCCLGSSIIPYRKRSVGSVISEIDAAICNHGARFIDFEDENLSLDRKWFMELLGEIDARFGRLGLELRAMNGLYPSSLDEDVIGAMKKAGFKTLNLSVGSFSKAQLKKFKRPDVRKSVEAVFRIAENLDLDTVCYIITGAPGQDARDPVADLIYLADKNAIAGVSVFYPAPGSHDYSVCERSGLLPPQYSLMRSSALPISENNARTDSATMLRLGRILNFMKSVVRKGDTIPEPKPYDPAARICIDDRVAMGKLLLKWFLHDGEIRGVFPDGTVYTHTVSPDLCRKFISGLDPKRIR